MEAKHTAGPWFVAANGLNKVATITKVTGIYSDVAPDDKRIAADARLIAAAPELLEALEEAENALADYIPTIERTGASLNYGHSVLKKARAAIAKATQ